MRLKMTLQVDPHNLKVIRFFLKERIGRIIFTITYFESCYFKEQIF